VKKPKSLTEAKRKVRQRVGRHTGAVSAMLAPSVAKSFNLGRMLAGQGTGGAPAMSLANLGTRPPQGPKARPRGRR
jgi:hypothetical protein